jgi:two-component system LytT family response regulator
MPAEWGVVIADDEPAARRGVRQLLAAFPSFHVVAECRNGTETLARLDEVRADVVFLDIQMPGIDGFEVIRRRTPERMPHVVFLTAYDEFALRAFEAQALDYLVKPVSEDRFAATMRRLTRQLRGGRANPAAPGIVVTTARGTTVLRSHEIDWIESADNYARLRVGGRSYLLRESMLSLEQRLRPHGFVRVHRTAIVRLGAVRHLVDSPGAEMVAVLASGARVPVSRRRRAELSRAVRGRT